MEKVAEAIETAYEEHIMSLYKTLSSTMASANGDAAALAAAQDRFKHGLAFAAEVRASARTAAGL